MVKLICQYFFIFMLYSVVGWIAETLLFIFRDKHFVKRGFLYGPLCPIYGTGAVLCSVLFYGRINNIFLLFIAGTVVCGVLEYVTHFAMEKLFHAMWWDYSTRRFNIKGRVYLKGLLTFGLGIVLIVKVIQPVVFKLVYAIPDKALYIICFVLYTWVLIDLAVTLTRFMDIVKALEKVQSYTLEFFQKGIDYSDEKLSNIREEIRSNERIAEYIDYFKSNKLLNSIKEKYPNLKIEKYKRIFEILYDKADPEKARTDIKLYGEYEGDKENKL